MPKTTIRIGRFEQPTVLFPVKEGEHYHFSRDMAELLVSNNGACSLEGIVKKAEIKKAHSNIWVDTIGCEYLALPSGYQEGTYHTQTIKS